MDRSAVDRCAELAWARYKPAAPTAPAALADPVARCIAALFGNGAAPAAPEAPRAPAAAAMSAAVAMSESEDEDEEEEEELASHGDGRRTNRGRKARCTTLIAEKLCWVERVEAQMRSALRSFRPKSVFLALAIRCTGRSGSPLRVPWPSPWPTLSV